MDTIARLIACFLLCFTGSVFASVPMQANWQHTSYPSCVGSDPVAVGRCSLDLMEPAYVSSPHTCFVTSQTSTTRNIRCNYSSYGFNLDIIVSMASQCPSNSINVAGSCICDAGYEEENGSCVPENGCPSAGTPAGSFTLSSKFIISVCNNGCQVVRHGDPAGFSYGGPMEWVTKFVYSGASCVPGEPPETDGSEGAPEDGSAEPTPPEDKQCHEKGLCPFNYNGKILCTKCDSKEGTTNESGSSSGSGTDSSGNATGDTGTTNTTKETTANCTNGSCNTTTTTTVTNPDGSTTTTTETESKPQADFCKSNPGHVVCKGEDEGTFGGSCASDFQCSGDAVQCAQAREVAKLRCVFDVSPDDPLAVAGGLAMNDQLTPSGHPGAPGSGLTVDVMDKIEESPVFGSSGNCISDRTFSVIGMSLTLPFASMCPYFNMIGNVFLSCCYLVAGFIVFRR